MTGLGGQALAYGNPGNWQRHGLLATNGILHAATLKTLPPPKAADPGAGIRLLIYCFAQSDAAPSPWHGTASLSRKR